jgi:hypothetical protein
LEFAVLIIQDTRLTNVMTDEEFEAAIERITNLYRFESLDEAIAERDRINAKLAPGFVLEFVGVTGAKRLAFTLDDLNTRKLLKEQTKIWVSTP